MTEPTQAIVFDCFGVLATDGWLPFKQQQFGHDQALLKQATAINKQADAGLVTFNDFIRAVALLAGMSEPMARQMIAHNIPNEPLFAYIRTVLKPHFKIGLLSNAATDLLAGIFTDSQVQLFDAIALSYDMGFIKPDKRAFMTIADRLGVPLEACVLIDDQDRYLTGARQAGMQTILYHDFDHMKRDLTKLLAKAS